MKSFLGPTLLLVIFVLSANSLFSYLWLQGFYHILGGKKYKKGFKISHLHNFVAVFFGILIITYLAAFTR
ncbi:MAG: hypothetical protein A2905_03710 [Candidatus Levybacteria bacterium RIFCSPLOWO2_01_FULL_36_10]|nr:MAG: hypothetical protein A2905_03710 [Candidatus Levybacteria bacterium RIFCSPLOWO2_01_FULL_36_10]